MRSRSARLKNAARGGLMPTRSSASTWAVRRSPAEVVDGPSASSPSTPTDLRGPDELLDGIEAAIREGSARAAARGNRHRRPVPGRARHRPRPVQREHPAGRRPAARAAVGALRRAGLRRQRRQRGRAGRGLRRGQGEKRRHVHARHGGGRGRGDRRPDLPRRARAGGRARPRGHPCRRSALPGKLPQLRLPGDASARARRSAATLRTWPRPCPIPRWRPARPRTARSTGAT